MAFYDSENHVLRRGIVSRMPQSFFPYQGWPTVTASPNGTLYTAASSFRMAHVCPFGKNVLFCSKDDGRTWSPPKVINDDFLDDRDAGILCLDEQTLLLSWFSHPASLYMGDFRNWIRNDSGALGEVMLERFGEIPPEQAAGGSFLKISKDGGVTWSDPIRVPVSTPHGPIRLKDGRLLYLGKEMYSAGAEETDVIAAYESGNQGVTWDRLGVCEKPADLPWNLFHEPYVCELPDGTLFGMIRAERHGNYKSFTMFSTTSKDGGRTWSPWQPTGVSGSPPHLLRHSSGALICTFGRREPPYGERAVVSYDGGKTWTDEYVLDGSPKDSDLGYPSSVELPDGSIMTAYYQKYVSQDGESDPFTSILYTVWKLNNP